MNINRNHEDWERIEARQLAQLDSKQILTVLEDRLSWKKRLSQRPVTYSRNVFIPVTNVCRNYCDYCGFVSRSNTQAFLLQPDEVIQLLTEAATAGSKEALFTLGEMPELGSPWITASLREWGFSNIVDYIRLLAEQALELGIFPHTNAGLLQEEEIAMLRPVNASMGLMLETSSSRLCDSGGPHYLSPGKDPVLRLKMIEAAGRQRIPFTTGILIGIGETVIERADALWSIRALAEKYGHIQEVIVQNFRRHHNSPMADSPEPELDELIATVALTRLILGPEANIQVPPNLNPEALVCLLSAGANDFGGISTVTKDFINPDHQWPSVSTLSEAAGKAGTCLKERLPVYPEFFGLLPEKMTAIVVDCVDKDGFVKE